MEQDWIRFKKDIKLVFVDCETFNVNLHFSVNRPWNIATLWVEGSTIVKELELMIKWDDCKFKISDTAAKMTHFNQQIFDTKAIFPQEAFAQFWPQLKEADYIIMHNGLRFDLYLLRGYAQFMGENWKFIMDKVIDTKSIAQGLKLNRPYRPNEDVLIEYMYTFANSVVKGIKTNLTLLAKEYGIPAEEGQMHSALYDLKINKQIWDKMKYQIEL